MNPPPVARRVLRLAALLAGLALPAAAADTAPKEALPPVVSVITAVKSELVDEVQVTGTLVAREEVLIGPEIEGLRIIELLADEGDVVVKGQVLVRLSRETLDAQLAQSNAALLKADASIAQAKSQIAQFEASFAQKQSALTRTQTLRNQGVATDTTLDLALSDARTTQAQLASARDGQKLAEAEKASLQAQRQELQVKISRAEVRTPTAGIVSRRSARLGAVATALGDPMFRVIAGGDIELEAEVPELRVAKMAPGQPAKVTLGDVAVIPGKLRLVSPEVDKSSRLGKVRIALEKNSALRIGAFARGTVEVARRTALSVPLSAILYDAAGPYVQGVRDGAVFSAPVKTGLTANGQVEVTDGVAEGVNVIAKAGSFLHDGDKVRMLLTRRKALAANPPAAAAEKP